MTTDESTRILKAGSVRNLGTKIAFNYEDLRERCDRHIEQVRAETKRIIEDAATEADSIKEKAREEAYRTGRRDGLKHAGEEIEKRSKVVAEALVAEQLKTTLPAMQAAAEALSEERNRWLAEWEAAAIRLCVAIAERIVRRELSIQPQCAAATVIEALELAAGESHISLRMHPEDADLLNEFGTEALGSMSSISDATVVPDESVTRGGCIVDTRHGVIDARLETQLERIAAELLQESDEE